MAYLGLFSDQLLVRTLKNNSIMLRERLVTTNASLEVRLTVIIKQDFWMFGKWTLNRG